MFINYTLKEYIFNLALLIKSLMSTRCKKGRPKGVKRAWCKKKLNQVFFHLNQRSMRKSVIYSQLAIVLIGIFPINAYGAMTPVLLVGDPGQIGQIAEETKKACSFFCKLALVGQKFVETKEGRTALIWLAWSGVSKGAAAAGLLAAPSYGTAALALAVFCSAAYGIETLIGSDSFVGGEFLHGATKWCVRGYTLLQATAILPRDAINYAIKILETAKTMG